MDMSNFIPISLFFFFPVIILSYFLIWIYSCILYPVWTRSSYFKSFPKAMYVIAALSAFISWIVLQYFSESATTLLVSGAAISILAAVIFYFFTNHIPETNNKIAAYRSFETQLKAMTQPNTMELQFIGNVVLSRESALKKIAKYTAVTRTPEGLASLYITYLHSFDAMSNDKEKLQMQRAALRRMERYALYFDQDVRSAFDAIEKYTDELLFCFKKLETRKEKIDDPTFREMVRLYDNYDNIREWLFSSDDQRKLIDSSSYSYIAIEHLMYFSKVVAVVAHLGSARMQLNDAIEKNVNPIINRE
ncbi:hypothetical protein [Enterovibrio norvegicus]|uniref:hypothetical protein n=1 Tax=Enterovibrio norvegicus TaxID=188144 RepID=UPI00352DD3D9